MIAASHNIEKYRNHKPEPDYFYIFHFPVCIMQCKLDVHVVGLCLLQGS